MARRQWRAPQDALRCTAERKPLRDGSAAWCMNKRAPGRDVCAVHARMIDDFRCDYCGGNDEKPTGHCADCTRPGAVSAHPEFVAWQKARGEA